MKTLQKFGDFSALYMAIFLAVLNYPSITDPAQKVKLLVEKQMIIFSTNLLMYVFFGVFLIVLALALHDRLKHAAPAMMQVATAIGLIWAGSLVASGMVSNAGIHPVIALYASDPAQAAMPFESQSAAAQGLFWTPRTVILGRYVATTATFIIPGGSTSRIIWFMKQRRVKKVCFGF